MNEMTRYPPLSTLPVLTDEKGRKLCRNCGMPIPRGRRAYCSQRCLEEFTKAHTWEFVRKDVLKRDRYKCAICGKRFPKTHLEIDHIIPVRTGIDPFDKSNLRTLCRDCHKRKTKLERALI